MESPGWLAYQMQQFSASLADCASQGRGEPAAAEELLEHIGAGWGPQMGADLTSDTGVDWEPHTGAAEPSSMPDFLIMKSKHLI